MEAEIIRNISIYSALLILVFYLKRIRFHDMPSHAIGVLSVVAFTCDLVGLSFYINKQPTAVIFNIYYILLFLILNVFYYLLLFKFILRTFFITSLCFFGIIFLITTLFFQDFSQNQSIVWTSSGIILLIYSIIYHYYLIKTVPDSNNHPYNAVWINYGILFYFAVSLFLFAMANFILLSLEPGTARAIWSIHNTGNIVKNIFFALGLSGLNFNTPFKK